MWKIAQGRDKDDQIEQRTWDIGPNLFCLNYEIYNGNLIIHIWYFLNWVKYII